MNRRVEDVVEHFNKRVRDEYWTNVSDLQKEQFVDFLESAKRVLIDKYGEYDCNGVCLVETKDGMSERAKPYFRLLIGYSIFGINGIKSGVYTEDSLNSDKTAHDHLIGSLKIGETAFIAYCKCGFDNDYMKNVWFYENLYLWLTIKVSSKEHKWENISRDQSYTIENKRNLKHYLNVSDLLYDLKEIVYFRIDDVDRVKEYLETMRKSKEKDFLSSMSIGESIIQDKQNKKFLNKLLKKGLVVSNSVYI